MAEYIDREALIAEFKRLKLGENSFIERVFADGVYAIIEQFPAADVAPVVHGRWMHEETEGGFHIWRCGRCGKGMNDNPEGIDLYCYHCGAKMDGVE